MTTTLTDHLDWNKPVFPSDNLAAELDALIDEIDDSVNQLGGSWGISDGGTEVMKDPLDLNFGSGLVVTDDADGSATIDADTHSRYTDSEAASAAPLQTVNGETGDVTVDGFSGSHTDLTNVGASDHHTKTTSQNDLVDFSSDSQNITVQSTEPTSPSEGDIWIENL